MKRVPRPPAEPASMAKYRADQPDDANAGAAESEAVWERFRSSAAYKDLRTALLTAQQALCGYCERRLVSTAGVLDMNDQQIEHVQPKAGGPGRTLAWENLMLCCCGGTYREKDLKYLDPDRHYSGDANVSCGQAKGGNDLPAGCDPRDFLHAPRLIDVALDGTMTANAQGCAAMGINRANLTEAIGLLHLNCERLRMAREKVVRHVVEWVVDFAQASINGGYLTDDQRTEFFTLVAASRLRPDQYGYLRSFWTTEHQYLDPWSSRFVEQNRAALGFPG